MRLKLINTIRDKLLSKKASIGTWQQIPDASISEILGKSNYDWVAIDMEHGSISIETLPSLIRAIELGGTLPLCRVSFPSEINCRQALDAGAGGVIIPMIKTAEQIRDIINVCCWPPIGNRGVGFSRANLFGKNFDQYQEEAQSPLIIIQIEHIDALNDLDNILNIKEIDAVLIGPYDLSASMGKTKKFNDKDFKDVLDTIINNCQKYNVPCGYHIVQPNLDELKDSIKNGLTFIPYSIDAVFLYTNANCPQILIKK